MKDKALWKRPPWIAGAALGLLLFAMLLIDARVYGDYAAQKISSYARVQGLQLKLREPELGLRGIRALRADIFVPHYFLMMSLNQVHIRPQILRTLALQPGLAMDGELYQGDLGLQINKSLLDDKSTLNIALDGCALATHPQILGLGISKGNLNLHSNKIRFEADRLSEAKIDLSLLQVDKLQKTKLSKKISGLPLDLTLPAFKNLNLGLQVDLKDRKAKCKLNSKSSLGEIGGQASAELSQLGDLENVDIKLQVHLKSAGQKALGSYLPLLSSGSLTADDRKFRVSIKGNLRSPRVHFQRLS